MKKLYLLSLMLIGSISLFTSCVDVDYYDLYDDEEFVSPRTKKGKDVTQDYSNYPRMNEEGEYHGWHKAECVACCYSNIYGVSDKATCRAQAIRAAYGDLNEDTYNTYFDDVAGLGIPFCAVPNLFGTSIFYVQDLAVFCKQNNVGSLFWKNVTDKNWVQVSIASEGSGTHVAKVHSLKKESHGSGYMVTIRVVDQTNNGKAHKKYHIYLDGDMNYVRHDDYLLYFIGSCN